MTRSAMARRLASLHARVPVGCPACRTAPSLVILFDDEPDPPQVCSQCGRALTGIHVVRIVQVERGPQ
jgi:ribosomal protein L34E